jgi:hypothetical protein
MLGKIPVLFTAETANFLFSSTQYLQSQHENIIKYVKTYICVCLCLTFCRSVCVYVRTYMSMSMCVCVCVCVSVCVCMYVRMYARTYVCTPTETIIGRFVYSDSPLSGTVVIRILRFFVALYILFMSSHRYRTKQNRSCQPLLNVRMQHGCFTQCQKRIGKKDHHILHLWECKL